MNSLTRIFAVVLRQVYLLRGSLTRLIPIFIWVALDMVLWGFLTRYLSGVAQAGFSFVPTFLGAVMLWNFCQRMMHGVTMAFFEDVWSRNFLNMFASPLRVGEYLTAQVATSILTSAFALVAMLLLASGFFGLSLFAYGSAMLPFLLILFLFGIAIGIVGCAVVLRWGPAAEWLVWPIPAILSPFACVFYPMAVLPHWMQVVASGLPPAYVFENIRTIMNGGQASSHDLMTGLVLGVLYIVIACLLFLRVYERAVRTGLIARYSAESIA